MYQSYIVPSYVIDTHIFLWLVFNPDKLGLK